MSKISWFDEAFESICFFITLFVIGTLHLIYFIISAIICLIDDLMIYIKVRFLGHKKIWVNDPYRDSFPIDVD